MRVNYINLTNGIEALDSLDILDSEFRFIRIQSTICEQKNWDRLIQDLDYDFLMNIALGNECFVYDYGANKPIPRAVYQGIEFLKYVLNIRWFGRIYQSNVSRSIKRTQINNCNDYFEQCYRKLDRRSLKKLDYFLTFVACDNICIKCVTDSTLHDGDKDYYRNVLFRKAV